MFIDACKLVMQDALIQGYYAINPSRVNIPEGLDLRPNSVDLQYPLEQAEWPALYIQFHPDIVQVSGLNPDAWTAPEPGLGEPSDSMITYFEGFFDLTIYSMTSQERDRLWGSVFNMFLLNPVSSGSRAMYNILNNNYLVPITVRPGKVDQINDDIGPGCPWDEELLIYTATVRVPCVGTYSNPYGYSLPALTNIIIEGTDAYGNERTIDIPPTE